MQQSASSISQEDKRNGNGTFGELLARTTDGENVEEHGDKRPRWCWFEDTGLDPVLTACRSRFRFGDAGHTVLQMT